MTSKLHLVDGGFEIEKPLEAVFVNTLDLLEYSVSTTNNRTLHRGTLRNNGSFSVSYDAGTGKNPDIKFVGQCSVRNSDESPERTSLYIRSKLE